MLLSVDAPISESFSFIRVSNSSGSSPRFDVSSTWNRNWSFLVFGFLDSIDFEEMVEDNQKHGGRAEEDGETVEIVVGNHICG